MTKAAFDKIAAGLQEAINGKIEFTISITFDDEDAPAEELLDLVVELVAERYPGFSGVVCMRGEPMEEVPDVQT